MNLRIKQMPLYGVAPTEGFKEGFKVIDTNTLNKGKECSKELLDDVALNVFKNLVFLQLEYKRIKLLSKGSGWTEREIYYRAIISLINSCTMVTNYTFLINKEEVSISSVTILEELSELGFSITSLYSSVGGSKRPLTISLEILEENVNRLQFTDLKALQNYIELNREIIGKFNRDILDNITKVDETKSLTLIQGIMLQN